MSKKELAKITIHNCADCIHNPVCNYKQEYLDICNAVPEANVYKRVDRNKVRVSNVTNYSDILGEIVIKCKHYYNGEKIRVDSNDITIQTYPPVTNPCDDLSTSQTATDPRLWTGVYTTAHN